MSALDPRLDGGGRWTDEKTGITVASGELMDPLHPRVEDIHITDIAHALSRICRYGGHVGHWLSVARHSVWVSYHLLDTTNDTELAFTGLLHDAAEAYIGDMVRPLKHGPSFGEAYIEVEQKLEAVIAHAFGMQYPMPPEIHEADNYVLLEKELSGPTQRWRWRSTPEQDEEVFMERFDTLQSHRRTK